MFVQKLSSIFYSRSDDSLQTIQLIASTLLEFDIYRSLTVPIQRSQYALRCYDDESVRKKRQLRLKNRPRLVNRV